MSVITDPKAHEHEALLLDAGWTKTPEGLYQNNVKFAYTDETKRHCQVPAGVTRTLAEALAIEKNRPPTEPEQPESGVS